MKQLEKQEVAVGRVTGPSPKDNKYYVLIMFDISNSKKYRLLTKILRRYAMRIQNSVYEAYLRTSDFERLIEGVERIMDSERYFDPEDRVRVYKVSGGCSETIYGPGPDSTLPVENNIFF